jgi:hypothetical protein
MKNEYVEIHVSVSTYLCETCDDYVTNVSSDINILDEKKNVILNESIYGNDHYGQIDWFSFFNPALNVLGVKVIGEEENIEGDLFLRVNYRNVSCQYGLDLEINQKVVASFDVEENENLPEVMQKIFSYITKNSKVFIHVENNYHDYDDYDNEYDE